jgi:hypothetical protein
MSSSQGRIDESVSHETAKKSYTPPLLTRYGTVEELTQISTDAVSTGSGIPTDFSTAG